MTFLRTFVRRPRVTPLPRPIVERAAQQPSFVGHAKLIGLLTLFSRVLGLGREVVMGHFLGTGPVASAFTVAFTIPNLFRKLFGEGALSAAFIPLYAQAVRREREANEADKPVEPSNAFAAASVNLLLLILIGVTLMGEVVIGGMILLGRNWAPDRLLALKYGAIMLPYVILICGTAFLGGILQVHKRFGPPAFAPVLLNVCHIAVVFISAKFIFKGGSEAELTRLAYWLSLTVLAAGALQVAILLPALRDVGFHFDFAANFRTPAIRRMLRLTLPVAIGAGVLQLSVLLDKGLSLLLTQYKVHEQVVTHFQLFGTWIRYPMESGAAARLNLAQLLYQFPLGVFAIALATAIFPNLSADAFDADKQKFRDTLRQGIEATLFECLPASLGLVLVREPAIRLLLQNGKITANDATLIAGSVLFYASAIWAFSLQQIISRGFYALHDTKTPLVMSIVTLAINLAVELPLVWTPLGEAGMAAGTCVSFIVQTFVMLRMLDRRVGGLGLRQLAAPTIKMVIATAVMGAGLWLLKRSPLYPHGDSFRYWAAQLSLLTAVGTGIYFGMCALMGVNSMRYFRRRPAAARGS